MPSSSDYSCIDLGAMEAEEDEGDAAQDVSITDKSSASVNTKDRPAFRPIASTHQ